MIKVNLLPPEYRVKERTPLPMMMGILGGVVLSSLSVVGFLYMRMGKMPEVNQALTQKKSTLEIYKRKAAKFNELTQKKAVLDAMDNAVQQLEKTRYPWAKTVDDLCWMVDRAEKQKRPIGAWYESLDFGLSTSRGARGKAGGKKPKLSFDLLVKGAEFDHVGRFRRVLLKEGVWLRHNIQSLSPPEIDRKEYQDYVPDIALHCPIEVQLLMPPVVPEETQEEEEGSEKGESK